MSKTRFDYNPKPMPDGVFKISPSSLHEFINNTSNWFQTKFMDKNLFEPNTGSTVGSVVHECLDCIVKGTTLPSMEEVEQFALSVITKDEYYNPEDVMSNWRTMMDLGETYIEQNDFVQSEGWVSLDLTPNIAIAGTYDGLIKSGDREIDNLNPPLFTTIINSEPLTLTDYKTIAGGLPPKKMERKHQWQLLCYAYALRKQNYNITHIEVPYISRYKPGKLSEKTNKVGKDYPSHITTITKYITQSDLDFIESIIHLVRDTLVLFFEHPEYANICFKDQRLKSQNLKSLVAPYQPKEEDIF